MDIKTRIALQFANQLLTSRLPIAAAELIASDAISDAATARFQNLSAAALQAVALWRRQTAPPAIAADVVRNLNGREQSIKIVPAKPEAPITPEEIHDMAGLIATYVQAAAAASATADNLVTAQLV